MIPPSSLLSSESQRCTSVSSHSPQQLLWPQPSYPVQNIIVVRGDFRFASTRTSFTKIFTSQSTCAIFLRRFENAWTNKMKSKCRKLNFPQIERKRLAANKKKNILRKTKAKKVLLPQKFYGEKSKLRSLLCSSVHLMGTTMQYDPLECADNLTVLEYLASSIVDVDEFANRKMEVVTIWWNCGRCKT